MDGYSITSQIAMRVSYNSENTDIAEYFKSIIPELKIVSSLLKAKFGVFLYKNHAKF